MTGYLAVGLYRLVGGILRLLPVRVLSWFACVLSQILYRVDIRHRRIGARNLKLVFGDSLSRTERNRILRQAYENIMLVVLEHFFLDRIEVDSSSVESIRPLLEGPQGTLLVSGHLGNWEIALHDFARNGYRVLAIGRPLDQPAVNRLLVERRESLGLEVVDKKGAVRSILKAMRQPRQIAGILVDQNAGGRGEFIDFLGYPASTTSIHASLARKRGIPVVVGGLVRVGPLRFRYVFGKCLDTSAVKSMSLDEILIHVNRELSALIQEYPGQWLWMHRRWKSRPLGEARDSYLNRTLGYAKYYDSQEVVASGDSN